MCDCVVDSGAFLIAICLSFGPQTAVHIDALATTSKSLLAAEWSQSTLNVVLFDTQIDTQSEELNGRFSRGELSPEQFSSLYCSTRNKYQQLEQKREAFKTFLNA